MQEPPRQPTSAAFATPSRLAAGGVVPGADPPAVPGDSRRGNKPRLLITAGPTHEPIDRVRYIGNRSSGRLGIALAEHAAQAGWVVTLLLGPTPRSPAAPSDSSLRVRRFQTTADLQQLLADEFPPCDCLVMAAAVADYRPRPCPEAVESDGKLRRIKDGLVLNLEPTPDLLAGCAGAKTAGQVVCGFALEPRSRLMESATSKLKRKSLDMIVANPLETMDSEGIEATVLLADGRTHSTAGCVKKEAFAPWLLELLAASLRTRR